MELLRRNTNRSIIPVIAPVTFAKNYLFRYQARIASWLVVGGVDNEGPHIFAVYPHGSTDGLPYATLGSGGKAAMSILESRWKPDMNAEDGMDLVHDAIAAGIFNDLGSGSNVDLCIIRKNYCKKIFAFKTAVKKGERSRDYTPKRGTTGILSTKTVDIEIVQEKVSGITSMEVDV